MGQRFTEEQLEQMIMQLEQGGLLQAPPSLERGVMEKIARLEEENGRSLSKGRNCKI